MSAERRDAGPDLADPASFRHWTTEKVRFQDINRFDHVSNVAIGAYAESGRVEFLDAIAPGGTQSEDAPYWVVAQVDLRFLAEVHFPGRVRIGTGVLQIGHSSARLGQGMFHGGRCVVTTEAVIVLVDPSSRRATPLPDALADALAAARFEAAAPDDGRE